jgi:hypothetical protein
MPYFEDLTKFSYHEKASVKNVINVGWLSKNHDFPVGKIALLAIHIIKNLVESPVNKFRGVHYCEFCPPPIKEKIDGFISYKTIRECPFGNGEIHVLGANGVTYIAPTLIAHYIEEHNYTPPQEFIDSVIRMSEKREVTD